MSDATILEPAVAANAMPAASASSFIRPAGLPAVIDSNSTSRLAPARTRKLTSGGDMAILFVEQYYDFARARADHYVVLSRGEVVARGDGATMEADNVRSHLAG